MGASQIRTEEEWRAELPKLRAVCANCHAYITATERPPHPHRRALLRELVEAEASGDANAIAAARAALVSTSEAVEPRPERRSLLDMILDDIE